MNEKRIKRIGKRIKHYFIEVGWNTNEIKGEKGDFSYRITLPYNYVNRRFFVFCLFFVWAKFNVNVGDGCFYMDFPHNDGESEK